MQSEIDEEASDSLYVPCVPLRQQNGEMGEVGSEAMQSRREEEGLEYGWSTVAVALLRSVLMHACPASVWHVGEGDVAPVSVAFCFWLSRLRTLRECKLSKP